MNPIWRLRMMKFSGSSPPCSSGEGQQQNYGSSQLPKPAAKALFWQHVTICQKSMISLTGKKVDISNCPLGWRNKTRKYSIEPISFEGFLFVVFLWDISVFIRGWWDDFACFSYFLEWKCVAIQFLSLLAYLSTSSSVGGNLELHFSNEKNILR